MMNKVVLTIALIVIVALAGGIAWKFFGGSSQKPINTTTFACEESKTIEATFYSNKVDVTLSDGRSLSLPQLISGSGARYGNSEESIIFWSKGDTAFITEGGSQNETYSNCNSGTTAPPSNANAYSSTTLGISLTPLPGYRKDESYAYSGFGPNKLIHGVKFSIPESMATGTNLASDSGVSLEVLPRANLCTGDIYVLANVKATKVTEGGITWSVASSSDAAAGNRYEEIVYAVTDSKPCVALRYFIHYGVIGNYPAGSVREFDRSALLADFDKIRASFKVNTPAAPAPAATSSSTPSSTPM